MKPQLGLVAAGALLSACSLLPGRRPAPPLVVTKPPPFVTLSPPAAPLFQPPAPPPPPRALACTALLRPAQPYPDEDTALRAAGDLYRQVQLLLAGRRARQARQAELEQALRRCVVAPPPAAR